MSEPIIGVNIEDNHISVGLVDIETRKVVRNTVQRKRVDPAGSADQIITNWSKVIREVAGSSKKIGIGLIQISKFFLGISRVIIIGTHLKTIARSSKHGTAR